MAHAESGAASPVPNGTRRPRVAVVIPCYNDAATLPETLASVERQEPCELVVVDDGSTDARTATLLSRIEAQGAQVIRQENSGPAAARMTGVRATTAPFVFPLDADDLLAPGALTKLADALERNHEAAMAWGDERAFGRTSVYLRAYPTLDPWLLTYRNGIPMSALIRRERLLEAGGWQLESGYEDWDLWLTFCERGWNGIYIPFVTVYYRVHAPRRLARDVRQHDEIFAEIRGRHQTLFQSRRELRRHSVAPRSSKLLFPLIDHLPFRSEHARHRVLGLAQHPLRIARERIDRRRGAPAAHP